MMQRRRQSHGHGTPVMLLAILATLLLGTPIHRTHATPLSTQVIIDVMKVHDNNARQLQLFPTDMITDLDNTNSTTVCPPDCPLCQCIGNASSNSTDIIATEEEADVDCLLSASIEACASKSFDKCFADLLPGDIDVVGLCSVQCDKDEEDIPSMLKQLCRICDIFACCNECPSERAAECFPSDIEDGYTPVGWEPATCTSGGGGRGGGGFEMMVVRSLMLTMSVVIISGILS